MADGSIRLDFPGHDGGKLSARLDMPLGVARAYAIFAHCFTCSKDILAASRIARSLAAEGIAVLRFDFTGLGSSEGEFANTNFSSNVEDIVAAADYLRETREAPQLLIGHSLGGAAVLAAAGRIDEVRAVATIGAPADAAHVVENFSADLERIREDGVAQVTLAGRKFHIKRQFLEDVEGSSVLDCARNLDRALLVMHAPLDETVGVDNARRIFEAAKHPKSFVSLDDADHLVSRAVDSEYAAGVLASWSQRYLDLADVPHSSVVEVSETGASKFQQFVRTGTHGFLADEPKDVVGGQDTGPNPYDFLSVALGTCTSMTLRMYAEHKKLKLGNVTVTVDHAKVHAKDCADCGEGREGRIDRFERRIFIEGDVDPAIQDRLVDIANKCPVHRTLEASSVVVTKIGEDAG